MTRVRALLNLHWHKNINKNKVDFLLQKFKKNNLAESPPPPLVLVASAATIDGDIGGAVATGRCGFMFFPLSLPLLFLRESDVCVHLSQRHLLRKVAQCQVSMLRRRS